MVFTINNSVKIDLKSSKYKYFSAKFSHFGALESAFGTIFYIQKIMLDFLGKTLHCVVFAMVIIACFYKVG